MVRAIAMATVLGALVGSIAIYSKRLPELRTKPQAGALDRSAETAIGPEAWPICTTMASVASDADWAHLTRISKQARGRSPQRIGMVRSQRSNLPHCVIP